MVVATQFLTYEQYLAEEEVNLRYDILDGVRIFMVNPTRRHQKIAFQIAKPLDTYNQNADFGEMYLAPCDVLVTKVPLRTRQPDVLLISHAQLAKCPPDTEPNALEAAPELVIEILSPSEMRSIRTAKIRDYCAIGVKECWVVSPDLETVEVLVLASAGVKSVATYGRDETLLAATVPNLTIAVADIFAP